MGWGGLHGEWMSGEKHVPGSSAVMHIRGQDLYLTLMLIGRISRASSCLTCGPA